MKHWLEARKQAMGGSRLPFFNYLGSFCSQLIKSPPRYAISLLELDLNNARNRQDLTELQQKKLPNFRTKEYFLSHFIETMIGTWIDLLEEDEKKQFNEIFPGGINGEEFKGFITTFAIQMLFALNQGLEKANFEARLSEKMRLFSTSTQINHSSGLFAMEPGKAIRNAAASGKEKELQVLLQHNPDMINATDSSAKGWTALHWAIERNHVACVVSLLERKARYDIQDRINQSTPIDIAVQKQEHEMNIFIASYFKGKYPEPTGIINLSGVSDLDLYIASAKEANDTEAVKILSAMTSSTPNPTL